MKPLLFASLLVAICLPGPLYAQDAPAVPVNRPTVVTTATVDLTTPAGTVNTFLNAFMHADLHTAVRCVSGATFTDKTAALEASMKRTLPSAVQFALEIGILHLNGDDATLTCRVESGNPQFSAPDTENAVRLHHEMGEWKIVTPSDPKITQRDTRDVGTTNFITLLAAMTRYPEIAFNERDQARAIASLSNVKQLALGCLMLAMDNDEKFALTPATLKKSIFPYTKNSSLFTSPVDPPGTISYHFNPQLANRTLAEIPRPTDTVMLFEGEWGKPAFRYPGDKAVIAFADGHGRLMTREQAKKLIWSIPAPTPKKP